MIRVSDKLAIALEAGMWVVMGGRIKTATFSRLEHACKYIVDCWAGEAAVLHEATSMADVIEHVHLRLHDTMGRVAQQREDSEQPNTEEIGHEG